MHRFAIYVCTASLAFGACPCRRASADATVVTRAMRASTIAEVFIEADNVRLKLEIGTADLAAFRSILSNNSLDKEAGEKPTSVDVPIPSRDQLTLVLADGIPLSIDSLHVTRRKRIARDQITGTPLAVQPEESDQVVDASIRYRLQQLPRRISIRPPTLNENQATAANIGFVAYHRGVAVNVRSTR